MWGGGECVGWRRVWDGESACGKCVWVVRVCGGSIITALFGDGDMSCIEQGWRR